MIFHRLDIAGLFMVELEPHLDERGFFARTFCDEEFGARDLVTHWPQCNLSHSKRRGTLRGLHFQLPPEPDTRLVRVARGAIFAAVADLRADGFGRALCCTLSAADGSMLYIPGGCAFGFQTLRDGTEVAYQMSASYRPALAAGVRWDDPDLGISWPLAVTRLSERDCNLPLLRELEPLAA